MLISPASHLFVIPPPHRYQHLIFDLGGVLINLDYAAPIAAFAALSGSSEPLAFTQQGQAPLFDALETGQLPDANFRAALRRTYALPAKATDTALDAAWNAILRDFPAERLDLLRALRGAGYGLYLLSNTNALHRAAFDDTLRRDYGLSDGLLPFFDAVYYSHEVGLRKPDPAIFRRVLTDHALAPGRTLFIDDSPQHVAAARTVGLDALWLEPSQTITAEFPFFHALRGPAA
ncbi:MAG: HAD family phosphatase [Hymenobacteraceae bacterium]|nr:HAD family phosphatase [Hymenobacteraceae bacterium]